MKLNNLKPAAGSITTRKRVGRDRVLVWVELLQEDIRAQNKDLDTLVRLVSKVVRCRSNAEFLNLALRI